MSDNVIASLFFLSEMVLFTDDNFIFPFTCDHRSLHHLTPADVSKAMLPLLYCIFIVSCHQPLIFYDVY